MAGTYGIGYCKLVIEDARGNTLRDDDELFVVSRSGRPDTGNWITVDKVGRFFVDRVEFLPEAATTARNFVYPVLYLRPAGARRTAPVAAPPRTPTLLPKRDQLTRKVMPLEITRLGDGAELRAAILPGCLVANLVTVGYRMQASQLAQDRQATAATLQSCDERLRDAMLDVLDTLAREAKFNAVQCQLLFIHSATAESADYPIAPTRSERAPSILVADGAGDWQVHAA